MFGISGKFFWDNFFWVIFAFCLVKISSNHIFDSCINLHFSFTHPVFYPFLHFFSGWRVGYSILCLISSYWSNISTINIYFPRASSCFLIVPFFKASILVYKWRNTILFVKVFIIAPFSLFSCFKFYFVSFITYAFNDFPPLLWLISFMLEALSNSWWLLDIGS